MPTADEPLVYKAILEKDGLKVSESPWGPDDEIGRLNWITPESNKAILESLNGSAVFDLATDYFIGMPSWSAAGDPPYDIWMTHTPKGSQNDSLTGAGREVHERHSYCGDSMSMYTHCGTHLDTLNHLGHWGCFWNGWNEADHLGSRHWEVGGAEKYPPIIGRSVLIDVAGAHGVDCLPDSYAIKPDEIKKVAAKQGTTLRKGDIVLIRTGRMTKWPAYNDYLVASPGIDLDAAKFLCEEVGAMCIGADSIGLEVMPWQQEKAFLPVHSYMFATAGAQIMEVMWLEEIAREKVYEFAFIGAALKLKGATGSPFRPIAVPLKG